MDATSKSPFDPLFSEVDNLMKKLISRPALDPAERAQLEEEFVIDESYNACAVDGNSLTLMEASIALEGGVVSNKPLKDILQLTGYRDGLVEAMRAAKESTQLSLEMIMDLNSKVCTYDFDRAIGRYRSFAATLSGTDYSPPAPDKIGGMMEHLLAFYEESDSHPIEAAILFHSVFTRIQPFEGGNSRTARLLLNYMLLKAGYPPITIRLPEIERYKAAIQEVLDGSGPDTLIHFVVDHLKEQIETIDGILPIS